MKEKLVSKEVAILAKEKGFDWNCNIFCDLETGTNLRYGMTTENYNDDIIFASKNFVSVPTQSFLQKWLRDVHKIHIEVWYNYETTKWERTLFRLDLVYKEMIHIDHITKCNTYEEALEAGLLKALKLI